MREQSEGTTAMSDLYSKWKEGRLQPWSAAREATVAKLVEEAASKWRIKFSSVQFLSLNQCTSVDGSVEETWERLSKAETFASEDRIRIMREEVVLDSFNREGNFYCLVPAKRAT